MSSPRTRLSIRLNLESGDKIGPGKVALLEAIGSTGSISAAARKLGMSYRRAWLHVEAINDLLQEPAVTAATGGARGGGAMLTPAGKKLIDIFRSIEDRIDTAAQSDFKAIEKLVKKRRKA